MGHTGGPWNLVELGDGTRAVVSVKTGAVIVEIHHWSDEVDEADGRLIAAAPDLLEAASNLIRNVRDKHPGEDLTCPHMRALDEAVFAAKQGEE